MSSDSDRWTHFVEGVQLVFKSWTVLQLAVENHWGGNQSTEKAEEFMEDILYWFTLCKKDPDIFALSDQLFAALLEDFNTEAEDGSLTEVAETLVALYHQCRRGNLTLLESLRVKEATLPPLHKQNVEEPHTVEESSDSEGEDEMVDDPDDPDAMSIQREPARKRVSETDSEGFTIVSSRRRK